MPIFFNKLIANEIHLMVWQFNESFENLLGLVALTIEQQDTLDSISSIEKKKEYLGGMMVLKRIGSSLGIDTVVIDKTPDGKPYFVDSDWEISLTHTVDFVAAVARKHFPIGIDIERPQEKILKIINRLFSDDEVAYIGKDIIKASIYWSAKEALYKLYGKRKIDFTKDLKLTWESGQLTGEISMPDYKNKHMFHIENLGKYYFVIAY